MVKTKKACRSPVINSLHLAVYQSKVNAKSETKSTLD